MRSYSETNVFSNEALNAFKAAERMVRALPDHPAGGEPWRCHEVARVIGDWTGLEVVDGHYGAVEHSWLTLEDGKTILDVYAVGSLPQVRLVHASPLLPHTALYRPGVPRNDIRHEAILTLRAFLFLAPTSFEQAAS